MLSVLIQLALGKKKKQIWILFCVHHQNTLLKINDNDIISQSLVFPSVKFA